MPPEVGLGVLCGEHGISCIKKDGLESLCSMCTDLLGRRGQTIELGACLSKGDKGTLCYRLGLDRLIGRLYHPGALRVDDAVGTSLLLLGNEELRGVYGGELREGRLEDGLPLKGDESAKI